MQKKSGFLPISTSRYLLPKLHKERCVIYPLQQQNQPQTSPHQPNSQITTSTCSSNRTTSSSVSTIHTSKSTKKKLKRFSITINQDFDGVVKGCHKQHGIAWLYPQIVASFKYIHELSKIKKSSTSSNSKKRNNNKNNPISNDDSSNSNNHKSRKSNEHVNNQSKDTKKTTNNTNNSSNEQKGPWGRGIIARLFSSSSQLPYQNPNGKYSGCEVKLYSVEVWNEETGQLAAGELGYTIGTIYTSLTGFSSEDSAGSVQLAALGKILCLSGYEMWDLGMSLDYKIHLGAINMERMEFVRRVKELRVRHPCEVKGGGKELKCDEQMNCKRIFGMKDEEEWNP